MAPSSTRQITELFEAVSARPPHERDAFLDEACGGDVALRQAVVSRLRQQRIGRSLGGYEIVGFLGAGGMGEVYRARDPKLRRDVAVKILSPDRADDVRRQQRFRREAQAVSALNHPNIVTVYDTGVEDGIAFIASELVDGTSLAEILLRAPLPVKDVLKLGAQIADGLASAHEAGIVHRDLKPDNVMVTRQGLVKIVDFGLAKAMPVAGSDAHQTRTARTQTEPGLILGTVPYMSPEQARGVEADFRSDQFSLGLILYEISTGTHPFRREAPVQTMSAILTDEPRPASELNARVPSLLGWTIERCLAKDPRQRYAATRDLAHDLATLRDRLNEAAVTPVRVKHGWRWPGISLGAAALALAVGGGVWLSPWVTSSIDLAAYRYTPFATDPGFQGAPAWSPDGKTLAFVAEVDGINQIFTRSLASAGRVQITFSNFQCNDPFWSPDSNRIYFITRVGNTEGLKWISPGGGQAQLVQENVANAAIASDGRMAFLRREDRGQALGWSTEEFLTLWVADSPDAEPTRHARPPFDKEQILSGELRYSPDGQMLAIWAQFWWPLDGRNGPSLWIIPRDGPPRHGLATLPDLPLGPVQFDWLPDSRRVIAALNVGEGGTHLWLADIHRNVAQPITIGSLRENFPAVSTDSARIAYAHEEAGFDIFELSLDGAQSKPLLATSRNESSPVWSKDGTRYAFETDRSGRQEIWIRNHDGEYERPVVTPQDFRGARTRLLGTPTFDPESKRIAYERMEPMPVTIRIWISNVDGGVPVELAPASNYAKPPAFLYQDYPRWSPNSDWVTFNQYTDAAMWKLMKARVGDTAEPQVLLDNIVHSPCPWSPDGHWIACETNDGLTLIRPDKSEQKVISQLFLPNAYGWWDSSTVVGIRSSDDGKNMVLSRIDVPSGRERILNPNLGPLPPVSLPVKGFHRVPGRGFLTAIAHLRSEIWLLEGFMPKPGLFERWFGTSTGR